MRNPHLAKHFPWLTHEQEQQLELLLWERAARGYEHGRLWRNAAQCWAQTGNVSRASELYQRSGDSRLAARVLLEQGHYAEALKLYESWGTSLLAGDTLRRVEALLGQAACHLLGAEAQIAGLNRASGQAAYQQACELLRNAGVLSGHAWRLVAEYGERVSRYDLVEIGYDRALAGAQTEGERVEILRVWLAAAEQQGDHTQAQRLAEQLAEMGAWQGESQPDWHADRNLIENSRFRDNVHDVLHFMNEDQMVAWERLAAQENGPEVDEYLRSLAPAGMVYIPAGAFLMGSKDAEIEEALAEYETYEDKSKPDSSVIPILTNSSRGQFWVYLSGYYIDHGPVTHAEYQKFMEAGGYQKREYWTESGWNWKLRKARVQPDYWDDPAYNDQNNPVGGVNWFEALAYSRWAGKTLPSEGQWEKAASWDPVLKTRRTYPWGDLWNDRLCNWNQGHPTPIDQYSPNGDSAYGLADMAGNVMEWCITRWGLQKSRCDYPYPYQSHDGRDSIDGGEDMLRIKRGGCFHTMSKNRKRALHCSHRTMSGPESDAEKKEAICSGFRCVAPYFIMR